MKPNKTKSNQNEAQRSPRQPKNQKKRRATWDANRDKKPSKWAPKTSKMKAWKTEIVAWKTEIVAPLIFKKNKKSTLRKAYKKWTSILGFIFFNRTFTQIFKKAIFRTIFPWRHSKLPRTFPRKIHMGLLSRMKGALVKRKGTEGPFQGVNRVLYNG